MPDKEKHPQRITERLLEYWEDRKRNRTFPSENDINPDDLGDVWDYCFLVNVADGKFKYSYMGQALIEAYGDDVTNEEVASQLITLSRPPLLEKFKQVAREMKPLVDEGEFVNPHKQYIRYRACLVPLGSGSGSVNYILGGMKWKPY